MSNFRKVSHLKKWKYILIQQDQHTFLSFHFLPLFCKIVQLGGNVIILIMQHCSKWRIVIFALQVSINVLILLTFHQFVCDKRAVALRFGLCNNHGCGGGNKAVVQGCFQGLGCNVVFLLLSPDITWTSNKEQWAVCLQVTSVSKLSMEPVFQELLDGEAHRCSEKSLKMQSFSGLKSCST